MTVVPAASLRMTLPPVEGDPGGVGDALVPWWAVALLDLERGSDEARVRGSMECGRRPSNTGGERWWVVWRRVVEMAHERVMTRSKEEWLNLAYEGRDGSCGREHQKMTQVIRDAALRSPRAFCDLAGLVDEEERPIILKDFHVKVVRDIRQKSPTVQLLPWEHGKLFSVYTPICTPIGMRLHGDLEVGDEVFGPDGVPARVVARSPTQMATLRILFSDGESFDVHPKHEWRVYERGRNEWRVMSTEAIAKRKYRSRDRGLFQVQYTKPLQMPERDLPLDPYTLGVWLGDGTTGKGGITHHPDDHYDLPYVKGRVDVHAATGLHFTMYEGLSDQLRAAGVLKDKHVPHEYLFASEQQRWDLLCGLIDTDGCVETMPRKHGRIRFVNCNIRLIEAVEFLARSFGWRSCRSTQAPITSSSGIHGRQPVYTVAFSPGLSEIPTRLGRNQIPGQADFSPKYMRSIVSIKAIEPVEGTCIQVDREDGLYLIGETMVPTHNSMLSSIVIPLMDLCEWENSTQARIYWSDTHTDKWIRRLMGQVEHNDNIHRLFPWVRRPVRGDRSVRWSVEGFSIGGRTLEDVSFQPMTVKEWTTGNRATRVVADDWVNTGNSVSLADQDKMYEYAFTGPMTMGQTLRRLSKYGTAWGTVAFIGTLFNENDVNYRLFMEFRRKGYHVKKYDVFPHGNRSRDRQEVLWPEYRPFTHVMRRKEELGDRYFNMRCRNMVELEGCAAFPEDLVRRSEGDGVDGRQMWIWGRPPTGARTLVAFDPGSGKLSKTSKNPAIVVYSEVDGASRASEDNHLRRAELGTDYRRIEDIYCHLVRWERLIGHTFTRQCDVIASWAREYQCPVVVEDNGIQTAYGDYMKRYYPDVRVVTHTTNENKRDPRDGVEQFVPLFEQGRVRLHCAGAPGDQRNALRSELTTWPRGRYTDLLMAWWIGKYQMRLRRGHEGRPLRPTLPSYASRYQRRAYMMGGRGR